MRIPFTQLVKPFGDNPSVSAESYYIRCRKPMPPLKGEGDREAVERCAPGANVSPFHNLPTHSKTPRDESLGALHYGESS